MPKGGPNILTTTNSERPGTGYPDSWYAATATGAAEWAALVGDIRADVCVIGGGFTGLSAALNLAERGVDVVLLEAERVGYGASGRNGGLVGSGQRKDVLETEALFGYERSRLLWDFAEAAKAEFASGSRNTPSTATSWTGSSSASIRNATRAGRGSCPGRWPSATTIRIRRRSTRRRPARWWRPTAISKASSIRTRPPSIR